MYNWIKQLETKIVGLNPDTIKRAWACFPGFCAWSCVNSWKMREKVIVVGFVVIAGAVVFPSFSVVNVENEAMRNVLH